MLEEHIRAVTDIIEGLPHACLSGASPASCPACHAAGVWRTALKNYYEQAEHLREVQTARDRQLTTAKTKLANVYMFTKKTERRYESIIRRVCRSLRVRPDLSRYDLGRQILNALDRERKGVTS